MILSSTVGIELPRYTDAVACTIVLNLIQGERKKAKLLLELIARQYILETTDGRCLLYFAWTVDIQP